MLHFSKLNPVNNFELQKENFKKFTGKSWDENLDTYIAYVNMKANDLNCQVNAHLLNCLEQGMGIIVDQISGLSQELLNK